jgi:uncharacterized protein (UPF0332 family)
MADFNWRGFINLAEALYHAPPAGVDREAVLRSVVNRAYYGAFKLAYTKALRSLWISRITSGSAHRQVILAFQRQHIQDHRKIGLLLDAMFRNRIKCDYHDQLPGHQSLNTITEFTISSARRVAALLNSPLLTPPLPRDTVDPTEAST